MKGLFPGPMVSTQCMLLTFGHLAKLAHPCWPHRISIGAGVATIYSVTPYSGYLSNIGRATLPSFNLHSANAHFYKLGEYFKGIKASGLFQGIIVFLSDIKAPLA